MGTRALILVEGSEVCIYRHWDGYPEAVLPELKPIVDGFFAKRGNEPDMLLANIVCTMKNAHDDKLLGYRLLTWEEAKPAIDVEYCYLVRHDGSICYFTGSFKDVFTVTRSGNITLLNVIDPEK